MMYSVSGDRPRRQEASTSQGRFGPRMAAEAVLRLAERRWAGRAGELSAAGPTAYWGRSEGFDDTGSREVRLFLPPFSVVLPGLRSVGPFGKPFNDAL